MEAYDVGGLKTMSQWYYLFFSARVAFVLIIIYCHAWLPYFDHAQAIIFHKFLNHNI